MSKARLEGICDYRLWETEELIEQYAFENKRINKLDALMAQKEIKKELKRRFNATILLLDDNQTTQNPLGTFNYLLGK